MGIFGWDPAALMCVMVEVQRARETSQQREAKAEILFAMCAVRGLVSAYLYKNRAAQDGLNTAKLVKNTLVNTCNAASNQDKWWLPTSK
jgi:hypothetical protein